MDGARIDALLEDATAGGALPGLVATAGDRDGVLYEGAAGVATDAVMAIASFTKALVSVAALQLVERGELDLDAPVARILPAFGDLQVLEGFDGDPPRLRAPRTQATIRQLLTHSSGLGYWFGNADLRRWHEVTGTPDPSSGKRAMFQAPLTSDPGTRWEYGTSHDWLGLVVEEVSGQELDAYCREHVWGPLAMPDTTFWPSDEQRARRLPVHFRTPDGGLVPVPDSGVTPEFCGGGGGAFSTAPDYLRFLRALLRGGELDGARVLQAETVDLALRDHLAPLTMPVDGVSTAIPELANDVPAWPVPDTWGLGVHLVLADLPGMRRAGTADWAGLFNGYWWCDRATGVTAVLMTQLLPFYDAHVVETLGAFEQAVYAEVGAATTR